MKTKALKILLIIESIPIGLFFKFLFIIYLISFLGMLAGAGKKTELLCEISPDGNYEVTIRRIGSQNSFSHNENIEVELCENKDSKKYTAVFNVNIRTGGPLAAYAAEWQEDGVEVILCGYESQYYILPFKTLEDGNRLLK